MKPSLKPVTLPKFQLRETLDGPLQVSSCKLCNCPVCWNLTRLSLDAVRVVLAAYDSWQIYWPETL